MSEEAPPTEGGPTQNQDQRPGPSQSQSQTQSTLSPSQVQSQSQGKSSSSGSSGSSGTLSSMDTIPVTLPSVPEEPEPEPPQPWARLLPMLPGFRVLDCVQDSYVVGRDKRVDYVIGGTGVKSLIYSKRHFRIYKEGSEAFVEDLSNNGTFVDGLLVGLKRKTLLMNNAVISMSYEKNRVFVFTDLSGDSSNVPQALLQKYALGKTIGTGVCGEVRLALERETTKKYAVKIINKGNFKSLGTATRNAETEIEILQRIDHPCLMKTVDFYETEESYFIVLELMEGGELFLKVKSKKQIPEELAKFYFYQMLLAVQYLHSRGIIHRDLKPENVLLSSPHEDYCLIKVTDFNQSRILEEAALMKTLCGTPSYLAPEVFTSASTEGYGLSVDAWSLGVLLFVCLGGYPPFHEQFGSTVQEQILSGSYTLLPKQWRHVSDQAKDLVQKLLVVDPNQRLNIEEALGHAWLQDEDMKQKVHRVMYPDPPQPSTSTTSTTSTRPSKPSSTSSTTSTTSSTSTTSTTSTRLSKPSSTSSTRPSKPSSTSLAAPQAETAPSSRKRTRPSADEEDIHSKKRK